MHIETDIYAPTHIKIHQVYKHFSKHFAQFGKKIVIAGGAPRDAYLGAEPKDYDIFVLDTDALWAESTYYLMETMIFKSWSAIAENSIQLSGKMNIDATYKQSQLPVSFSGCFYNIVWKKKAIQIMHNVAKTGEELCATFDWNICSFYYDGKDYYSDYYKHTSLQLNIDTLDNPWKTLKRGCVFSYKYHVPIYTPHRDMLIEALATDNDYKILKRMEKKALYGNG